ncbi:hypothetical protein [Streptomyces sp. NPDC005283]|uniref:SCO2400 family protein n=1 Tax=Streptomyces sp. NPDC005283 TaxID=3156871 RepID=UPI00345581DC
MDYCNQCRRHLNGALACAGCGTPVEELRRHHPSAPAAEHVYELDEVSEPVGHRRARRQPPPRRRSAGTRRARKRRGRKVLLGTVGLVLAAGALSLAELATENKGDDGAATAVKEDPSVETEPAPEPTDVDVTPEGPDAVTEPPVSESAAVRPTGTGPGTGTGNGSGNGSGSGSGTGSGGDGKQATSGPASPSSAAAQPSGSAQPSSSEQPSPSAPGGGTQPSAEPTPTASPTQCNRFLWWCL